MTSHHKVVAEIGPPSSDIVVRKAGALHGKIKVADDFDSLPADVLKAMERGVRLLLDTHAPLWWLNDDDKRGVTHAA